MTPFNSTTDIDTENSALTLAQVKQLSNDKFKVVKGDFTTLFQAEFWPWLGYLAFMQVGY